ncbi:MAG: hypothetical protein EOP83_13575 [Verrucomicrobiaceae bacterium]|nr:MAG: hypothetical protein EOP83_13575 [Verrucomicrobiaceae bacterium]
MARFLHDHHITMRDRDYYIVFPNDDILMGLHRSIRVYSMDKESIRAIGGPIGTVRDMWKWVAEVGDGYWSYTDIRCSRENEKIQRMFDRPEPVAFLFTDRETAYNFRFRYGDKISPNPVKVEF